VKKKVLSHLKKDIKEEKGEIKKQKKAIAEDVKLGKQLKKGKDGKKKKSTGFRY
jgi:hypothetical protein